MQNLKITLIQSELRWHNVMDNIAHFDAIIKSIKNSTNLIILPEMFTTGFTMIPIELAEKMDGAVVKKLIQWSEEINADITGSVVIKEDGHYYNRLIWVKPDKRMFIYDKRHLFRMAGEEKVYNAGNERITVDINGWRLRPFICYDLRFPVWTRNIHDEYDIAVFVANWPSDRASHWNTLLRARAIENQCYVIGVNRIGTDGNGISYSGDSSVIDFAGNVIFEKRNEECAYTIELSYDDLRKYREAFPAWKDADDFNLVL